MNPPIVCNARQYASEGTSVWPMQSTQRRVQNGRGQTSSLQVINVPVSPLQSRLGRPELPTAIMTVLSLDFPFFLPKIPFLYLIFSRNALEHKTLLYNHFGDKSPRLKPQKQVILRCGFHTPIAQRKLSQSCGIGRRSRPGLFAHRAFPSFIVDMEHSFLAAASRQRRECSKYAKECPE
jgi:hypothetical protein